MVRVIAMGIIAGVQHIDEPLQVKYWGVRTPVTTAALTPMVISIILQLFNNNNNNTLIYIAPACRMTSEALADSSSRATDVIVFYSAKSHETKWLYAKSLKPGA